jgi:hypothetical protein
MSRYEFDPATHEPFPQESPLYLQSAAPVPFYRRTDDVPEPPLQLFAPATEGTPRSGRAQAATADAGSDATEGTQESMTPPVGYAE